MARSPHKIVSTLEALVSSIDNDSQVYRWFAFFVSHPKIKAAFSREGMVKDLYRNLDRAVISQEVIVGAGLLLMVSVLYFERYVYLWGIILLLYPFFKLHLDRKRWVREITTRILVHDFEPAELSQKTLYQISEIYGRKYNIPSFIDAVYFADTVTRKSMIIALLCLPFVIQMNLWQAALMFIGAYYVPYLIATHPVVFNRLK